MTEEMDRREFIGSSMFGLLATQMVPQSSAQQAPTTSEMPLPANRHFDSQKFCLSEYDAMRPALTFVATDRASATRWQERARTRLVERLGGFPSTRVPLRAEVLETKDLGGYTREKIVFDTRHNLSAIAYLLLPKQGRRPFSVVVAVPGHGRGVDEIIGVAVDGTQILRPTGGYIREYAAEAAERGYAVLAIEPLAFGSRRDDAARASGPSAYSCRPAACAAFLFGQTMIGWRSWDVMRGIDYLETRSEVDARRLALIGTSGGGTTSLFTAAVEPRVKASVVSAYFNTFHDSIVSISHCPDNYVPGLLHDMEMYDLAGLIAPRALFVESGTKDRIFPADGFRTAVEKARGIYQTFGVSERFDGDLHEGPHGWHGGKVWGFLEASI
jgi:dienelactone hydrolase